MGLQRIRGAFVEHIGALEAKLAEHAEIREKKVGSAGWRLTLMARQRLAHSLRPVHAAQALLETMLHIADAVKKVEELLDVDSGRETDGCGHVVQGPGPAISNPRSTIASRLLRSQVGADDGACREHVQPAPVLRDPGPRPAVPRQDAAGPSGAKILAMLWPWAYGSPSLPPYFFAAWVDQSPAH